MTMIPPPPAGPASVPLKTFPYMVGPYSNIVPWTHRDGISFIAKFDSLVNWTLDDMVPHINREVSALVEQYNVAVSALAEAIDANGATVAENYDKFVAVVDAAKLVISVTGADAREAASRAEQAAVAAAGSVSGIASASAPVDLSPVYIETRDTGMVTTTPANIRAGLSTAQYATGGFISELTIAVTGQKGSTVLTATDTSKMAGLGNAKFAGVLNSTDKRQDIFVTVMGNDGLSSFTLRKPLRADFTGTLSTKYDSPLGQHLTKGGTRAFVQHALESNDSATGRGPILAGTWDMLPPAYNREWSRNAASEAYGTLNSAAPVVRTDLTVQGAHNPIGPTDKVELHPTNLASGMSLGTHKKGHGAVARLYTGRKDSTVEFYTSAQRSVDTGVGYALRVTVVADGVTLYNERHDAFMTRVVVPVSGFDKVEINVTNDNDVDTPYYIYLSNLKMREAPVRPRIGQGTIVVLADSWGEFYDGLLGKVLSEKSGAKVITRSKGGTTSDWALAWFNEYVLPENPDECWIHFYINDSNYSSGSVPGSYTDPAGNVLPLWPSGLTLDTGAARWRQNIMQLIHLCQRAGIRPVVFIPGGTASEQQTTRTLGWAPLLERPPLAEWTATAPELADPASYVNTTGKKSGSRVMSAGLPKYATGPAPTDVWS